MRMIKLFLVAASLGALLTCMASSALAEQKQEYDAKGNNLGIHFTHGTGAPLGNNVNHYFPRGSANYFVAGRNSWGVSVLRDMDGDGTVEDTLGEGARGGRFTGMNSSLESYSELEAAFNAGESMDQTASRIDHNRTLTSIDPEDLADWYPEFRDEAGQPILHGVETVVMRCGDAFQRDDWPAGASFEHRFHFLNFAESNNIMYAHTRIRNMSEYLKWNPNPDIQGKAASQPNGQTYKEFTLHRSIANNPSIGGRDSGNEIWGYYTPLGIHVFADKDGIESSFSTDPFIVIDYVLRLPEFNGQVMQATNLCYNTFEDAEFGFNGNQDTGEQGYPFGKQYHLSKGRGYSEYVYGGSVNPFDGKVAFGYPGLLEPSDTRYNRWLWGDRVGRNMYWHYGWINDFAPRDTCSYDWVVMFTYGDPSNFAFPRGELSNMDNEDCQKFFAPAMQYASVARLTWEGGYVVPETPVPPALTIIPGDRQVTITWSDINVNTPDAYYAFLQANPELDPNHVYVEYDFEGYRLYRSYVGPNDSHSVKLLDCSKSAGNIVYYYVDKKEDDQPLQRMENGQKVWYALVPFDKNYDPVTGDMFSQPSESSGKVWNRVGPNGLYTVIPRSDASNFKAANAGSVTFQGAAAVDAATATLSGDGTGKLTSAPQLLMPAMPVVKLIPVNSERISQNLSTYITCDAAAFLPGGCNWPAGVRTLRVTESSSKTGQPVDIEIRNGSDAAQILLNGPVDANGINYALDVTFSGLNYSDLYFDWDKGSYDGASAVAAQYRCGPNINSAPNIVGWTRNAQYSVTWKNGSAGMLTLEVKDVTRNQSVDFGEQPDDFGWGFVPAELIGDRWGAGDNIYNQMADGVPKTERTNKMSQEIAADNTESFGIYLNGIFWMFEDVVAMPAAGATMTVTTVFGTWNDDQTEFTQYADPPLIGDSWKVEINASTLKAEDADLSKIRVVPNPYIASSFLDLSADSRRIEFVNLPDRCTIRIYSMGGHLVNVLNHIGANRNGWGDYTDWDRLTNSKPMELTGYDNHGGTEPWNMRNRFGTTVASGLYFYHVTDSRGKTATGKFYIVN